jgi:hypothetical protein
LVSAAVKPVPMASNPVLPIPTLSAKLLSPTKFDGEEK